jgi:hypothetical protein
MDFWETNWKECIETEVRTFIWKMGFHVVKETHKWRIDILVVLYSDSFSELCSCTFYKIEKNRIPTQRPERQNWKCYRLGFIELVHWGTVYTP